MLTRSMQMVRHLDGEVSVLQLILRIFGQSHHNCGAEWLNLCITCLEGGGKFSKQRMCERGPSGLTQRRYQRNEKLPKMPVPPAGSTAVL